MKASTRRAFWGAVAIVAGMAGGAGAEDLGYAGRPDCYPSTAERPYVCDIGQPKPLSYRSFQEVLSHNGAVRAVVARLGLPDWAEIQKVSTDAPWNSYEVRTYYRDSNRMYAFARAFILDSTEIVLVRYQGPIPPGKFPAVRHARLTDADQDALRAERAAAEAEARAEAAERGADRAAQVAEVASQDFKRSLVKQ